jgi:shikimate dehydrogenase
VSANAPALKLGLIGHPVSHSLSPLMHRAALSFCKIPGTYELIDIPPEQLTAMTPRLKSAYHGLNVTIPHKQAVIPFMDELTGEARLVQAVNTIAVKNGRMIGHNTDGGGFLSALKGAAGESVKLPCVCIIGAGGAARAALWAVSKLGAQQVVIYARTQRDARKMCDDFMHASPVSMQFILRSPGEPLNSNAPALIVNCTPIGLSGEVVPEWIVAMMNNSRRGQHIPIFFDMVYSRGMDATPLVKKAAQLGLVACDGLQMLIEQAAMSFEFWTGIKVPSTVLAEAIRESVDPAAKR